MLKRHVNFPGNTQGLAVILQYHCIAVVYQLYTKYVIVGGCPSPSASVAAPSTASWAHWRSPSSPATSPVLLRCRERCGKERRGAVGGLVIDDEFGGSMVIYEGVNHG